MKTKNTFILFGLMTAIVLGGESAKADLIGYWPFDEGHGTKAADVTGNGNDGTFNGEVEWVAGYNNSALRFDTAGERIVVGPIDPSAKNNAMTLAAWINWEGEGRSPGHQGIFGKRLGWDPPDAIKWFWQATTDGDLLFRIGGSQALSWGNRFIVSYPNEWIHVALTWDNGAAIQYINGEVIESGNITFRDTADDTPVTIGSTSSTNGETFLGIIDEARIYDHALTQAEIQTIMLGFGFPTAFSPTPTDSAVLADTWASLSWKPGTGTVSHNVYFGDNFDEVDLGAENTFQGNLSETFIVIGLPGFAFSDGLVPGTTYFWRVDEFDGTETHKGNIWSFLVAPKTAYFPDPADGAEVVDVDVQLSWTTGFGAKLHTVYFDETFEEVENATGGSPQSTATYTPGTLKMAKTYYWRVDEFDIVETQKGDIWSFTTVGAVGNPNPSKGAVDVTQTPTLTWTPGFGTSHEVYFGTDESTLELKGSGNLGSESYDTGELEWNSTYYWRVDEANNANPDSSWTGPLWSFTTANFLIIDDFESYNDLDEGEPNSNRIYHTWEDGFDNPSINGSIIGHANPPFTEQGVVHGGNQSMPMSYENSVGKSEATLTLTGKRDWTRNGVTTLTIWFRGDSTNTPEQMYVTLNGNARIDYDNPDAPIFTSWTRWNIDLQFFVEQGVDLTDVDSITIGLDSVTGGTGYIFFDDIRLYAR